MSTDVQQGDSRAFPVPPPASQVCGVASPAPVEKPWNLLADKYLIQGRRVWDFLIAFKLLCLLAIIVLRPYWISHDCAFLLQIGDLISKGKLPYIDFIELNPPLIQYLSVLPDFVARMLGFHVIPVFLLGVWLLVVASTLLIRYLLSRATHVLAPGEGGMVITAILVGHECTMLCPDFGQREHLFLILYLPFMVLRWLRCHGVRIHPIASVALGLCAGVGVCIKPYFLFSALVVEAYLCISSRSVRQAFNILNLGVALAGAAYPLGFLLIPPEISAAFFGRWVPFIATNYSVYSRPLTPGLAFDGIMAALIVPAVILAFYREDLRSPRCQLGRIFAIFTLCGFATYLYHAKSYFYQLLPALFGYFVCLGFNYMRRRKPHRPGSWVARYRFVPLMLIALMTPPVDTAFVLAFGWLGRVYDTPPPLTQMMLDQTGEGDPVLFVSTSVSDGYPEILQYHRRPASRHLYCFPIALSYKDKQNPSPGENLYHSEPEMSADERLFLQELKEDILRNQPVMIAIIDSDKSQGCPRGFRVYEYLRSVGFLEQAMDNYEYIGCVAGKFDPFRVFIRKKG